MARFVHYLYYRHYYPSIYDADKGLSTLDLLKVALVDKYDVSEISTIKIMEETGEDEGKEWAQIITHSKVYVLADKYDVPRLKEVAMEGMVDLMHNSDDFVVWDIVRLLNDTGIAESKWKDRITEYLDAHVADFMEDDRFYEWIFKRNLVKQMMQAAFQEGKETS